MGINHFTEKIPGLYYLNEGGSDIIWLLVGAEKALLVDTGFGRLDLKAEAAKVTDRELILVNTHMHPDHAAGNGQFEIAYCAAADLPLMAGMKKRMPEFTEAQHTLTVEEGDTFDLGRATVEVIAVPGHTPGSIGLLWREARILLIGDACNQQVWLHLEHSLPLTVFAESMQKLVDRAGDYDCMYTSHGESGMRYTAETPRALRRLALQVASGQKHGEPATTHLGHKAMLIMEDGVGFYFDPEKV
jgi:glyoxylase-like metal-dependent hydrolase (beta-lactamase superfamily II)